jgi:hypothetical protein
VNKAKKEKERVMHTILLVNLHLAIVVCSEDDEIDCHIESTACVKNQRIVERYLFRCLHHKQYDDDVGAGDD